MPAPPSAAQPKSSMGLNKPHFLLMLQHGRGCRRHQGGRGCLTDLTVTPHRVLRGSPEDSLGHGAQGHRERLSAAFSHYEVPALFEKCEICIPASSSGVQTRRRHVGWIRTRISWNTPCKQMNFQKGGLGLFKSSPA